MGLQRTRTATIIACYLLKPLPASAGNQQVDSRFGCTGGKPYERYGDWFRSSSPERVNCEDPPSDGGRPSAILLAPIGEGRMVPPAQQHDGNGVGAGLAQIDQPHLPVRLSCFFWPRTGRGRRIVGPSLTAIAINRRYIAYYCRKVKYFLQHGDGQDKPVG